jgi:hypothetical protein
MKKSTQRTLTSDEYPRSTSYINQQQQGIMNGRRRDNDQLLKQQQQQQSVNANINMNGNKAELHIQALSQKNHRLAKELVSFSWLLTAYL